MSGKGNSWDNAVGEIFSGPLKKGTTVKHISKNSDEARRPRSIKLTCSTIRTGIILTTNIVATTLGICVGDFCAHAQPVQWDVEIDCTIPAGHLATKSYKLAIILYCSVVVGNVSKVPIDRLLRVNAVLF